MGEFHFNENIAKAFAGDSDAQFEVGMCYLLEKDVKRNYKEAYNWISKSAEQNNVRAIHMLGEFYKNGIYVSENYDKALTYYNKAADMGSAASQNEVGINYAKNGDFKKALSYFLKAAEKDYSSSMTNIARIYLDDSININAETSTIIDYLQRAIELNDHEAMNILGCLYLNGKVIPKNSKEAIKLFKKSAKQDNPYAKLNLANLYEEGKEINQDIEKAVKLWYEVAYDYDIEEASKKVKEYALKNCASAQYYYSNLFEFEERDKALEWLNKSADNGFAAAQYDLGICYRDGVNVEKSYEKAKYYLTAASNQYYDGALFALNVLKTYSSKDIILTEQINDDDILFDSLECQTKDLKNYKIEDKGNINSVFVLKIFGKVGPGSLREGGSINKWLEESNFNGKIGLDLSAAEGLEYIPNNAFYNAPFRRCNIKLKYVYLPNTVKDIGSCAFANQKYLREIKYSNDLVNFQSCCLEATSITEFSFPEKYSIWDNSVTWSNLRTIIFPSNFTFQPPLQPDYPSKDSEKFNNWDLFIERCSGLQKIIINKKEEELEKRQQEFLNFIKKNRPEIQIELL